MSKQLVLTEAQLAEIVKYVADAATKAGAKVAMETWEKQKQQHIKSRYDKRLRNTRLLLKNYQLLKDHCDNAVYDKKEVLAIETSNVIDILDSLEGCDRYDFIMSIKASVTRTKVILSHIDEMVKIYQVICERSDKPNDMRQYRIVNKMYFDEDKMTPAEICKSEGIDQSTYYRDNAEIVKKLSTLFFGIDGLSEMRKKC